MGQKHKNKSFKKRGTAAQESRAVRRRHFAKEEVGWKCKGAGGLQGGVEAQEWGANARVRQHRKEWGGSATASVKWGINAKGRLLPS